MKTRLVACALVCAPPVAAAQNAVPGNVQVVPAPVAAAPTIAAPTAGRAVLRTGTEVPLKLAEELTTKGKRLKVGQRFRMETSEPMLVQGVAVIPVGSPAMGEVIDVRNKGMWGKSGHLGARVLYVTVNGRQIRMSGAFDDKGVAGGVGATAVSALMFLPAGFFMTGTSARVPLGAPVKGFVDEDVGLAMAATPMAPMAVSAPVVAASAQAASPVAPASTVPTAQPAVLQTVAQPPKAR